jgi:DNA-binding winged helix-turn-helix (wHTH) protein/tetratricopeptide (TPR) repeat protein
MGSPVLPQRVYRFGVFQLDTESGILFRQGRPASLQGQPLRVLCQLLQRPGEIVTREELCQALWPDGTYVEFEGSLNAALKRLRFALSDDADNPTFIETVPKQGYRFIAPVAIVALPAVDHETPARQEAPPLVSPSSAPLVRTTGSSPLRYYVAGSVAVLAVIALALLTRSHRLKPATLAGRPAPAIGVIPRRSVAIMDFQNASGQRDVAWLSTAIPEMLSTELAAGDQLKLIPGEDVARMAREFHLGNTDTLATESAVRAGRTLSANVFITGSFVVMGSGADPRLRIDLRLQDANTGEVMAELAETGRERSLFDLLAQAGSRVRRRLGIPGVSADQEVGVRASVPSDPDAARLYAKGVALLRNYDAAGARDLLTQAVAAEPSFPLSHAALASAWSTLGYTAKARAEAKKALDLSASLPRTDRLLIEGWYHVIWSQRAEAISAYRALFALFPDSVDDGLLLANAQASGGQPNAAFETVKALRALPPPVSGDPRIDLAEAHIFGAIGDLRRQIEAAERARKKATALHSALLAATAEFDEVWPLMASGHPQEATTLCQEMLGTFAEVGDRLHLAAGMRFLGDARVDRGELQDALQQYRQALQISEATGNLAEVANTLNEIAIVYEMRSEPTQAEKLYRRSYQLFLETGDRATAGEVLGNVGDTLVEEGKLGQAARLFQQELTLGGESGAEDAEGGAYSDLALLAFSRGQLKAARQFGEKSVAIKRALSRGYDLAATLELLATISRIQGDAAAARQTYGEALALDEKTGAKVLAGEARLSLAEMDLDDGRAAQAEPPIRQALLVFARQNVRDDELRALAALSRCLVMQNRAKDAENALDQGREMAGQTQNLASKLRFAIADARVKASPPDRKLNQARAELVASIGTAHRLGLTTLEYRARLALAEVLVKAEPAAGKRYAASLAQQSRAQGFGLIAHRAETLLQSGNPMPTSVFSLK